MRYLIAGLGVAATGVFLAVSMTMNWRFGFQLGRTEFDGQIYGAASAAADCMKALVPFFFFAAWKARQWAQMTAALLVGVVVTAYSLTSALGHAALNRSDTTNHRLAASENYKDARADLSRAKEQLSWIPQHRPATTVQADIDALQTQKLWAATSSCKDASGAAARKFCQGYHGLVAELGSAQSAMQLETRIADISGKLMGSGAEASASADPQAAILAGLFGFVIPGLRVEDVQMMLIVFVALLLEVVSCFGLYISLAHFQVAERVKKPSALQSLDLRGDRSFEPVTAVPATHEAGEAIEASSEPLLALQAGNDTTPVLVPDKTAANDDEAITDNVVPLAGHHIVEPTAKEVRAAIKAFLAEACEPTADVSSGTAQEDLRMAFLASKFAAGNLQRTKPRWFANALAELKVERRRMRDVKGDAIARPIFYAVRPVAEVPVSAAA